MYDIPSNWDPPKVANMTIDYAIEMLKRCGWDGPKAVKEVEEIREIMPLNEISRNFAGFPMNYQHGRLLVHFGLDLTPAVKVLLREHSS